MKKGYIFTGPGYPLLNEQRRALIDAGVKPEDILAEKKDRTERDEMLSGYGWRAGDVIVIARADVIGKDLRDRRAVVELMARFGASIEAAGSKWPLTTDESRAAFLEAATRAQRGSGGSKGGRPPKFTMTKADEAEALAIWQNVKDAPTVASAMLALKLKFGPSVKPSDFYARFGPRKPKKRAD